VVVVVDVVVVDVVVDVLVVVLRTAISSALPAAEHDAPTTTSAASARNTLRGLVKRMSEGKSSEPPLVRRTSMRVGCTSGRITPAVRSRP
jgi:hypothetical protein